jgi:hypothetical protein
VQLLEYLERLIMTLAQNIGVFVAILAILGPALSVLVSILKGAIELWLPADGPTQPAHDVVIQTLNVVIGIGAAVAIRLGTNDPNIVVVPWIAVVAAGIVASGTSAWSFHIHTGNAPTVTHFPMMQGFVGPAPVPAPIVPAVPAAVPGAALPSVWTPQPPLTATTTSGTAVTLTPTSVLPEPPA